MATSFFGGEFFGGEFFSVSTTSDTHGKGDNAAVGRSIFKPTGLVDRPVKLKASPTVTERVEQAEEIHAQVVLEAKQAYTGERISLTDIDREIGALLRKQIRTQEDEILILLLMAAATC